MSDYSPNDYGGYDNEFDDDYLYDNEDADDLAGDLASHACPSPNTQYEEPGDELQNYHSDWEYYSDDYYDDDPSVAPKEEGGSNPEGLLALKGKTTGKGKASITSTIDSSHTSKITMEPSQSLKTKHNNNAPRGTKRKLSRSPALPSEIDSYNALISKFILGTIYKRPQPQRNNIFVPGSEPKVAFLPDWRERFGTTGIQDKKRKLGQGDGQDGGTGATGDQEENTMEDESWANDLSLADMGLRNERKKVVEAEIEEEEDGDLGTRNEDADEEMDLEDDEADSAAEEDQYQSPMKRSRQPNAEDPLYGGEQPEAIPRPVEIDEPTSSLPNRPSKKLRTNHPNTKTKPMLPSPSTTNESTTTDLTEQTKDLHLLTTSTAPPTTKATIPQSRKRKASSPSSPPVSSSSSSKTPGGLARSTASTRAKRIASTANNVTSSTSSKSGSGGQKGATGSTTTGTTRVTRARKR